MCDIYDLEEKIMNVWNTSNDLDVFLKAYMDFEKELSEDEIFNILNGIKELHNIRCMDLFDSFEKIIEGK